MTSYWPQLEFLGDFHTHRYRTVDEVMSDKLYEFSETDWQDIEGRPEHWYKHRYRLGMVLSIAYLKRASSRRDRRLDDGVLKFTLGNYRLWLKGYVAYGDQRALKLPFCTC